MTRFASTPWPLEAACVSRLGVDADQIAVQLRQLLDDARPEPLSKALTIFQAPAR